MNKTDTLDECTIEVSFHFVERWRDGEVLKLWNEKKKGGKKHWKKENVIGKVKK